MVTLACSRLHPSSWIKKKGQRSPLPDPESRHLDLPSPPPNHPLRTFYGVIRPQASSLTYRELLPGPESNNQSATALFGPSTWWNTPNRYPRNHYRYSLTQTCRNNNF